MTDTWKPQPGKPAMTRDEKTLVTDLGRTEAVLLWSGRLKRHWTDNGKCFSPTWEREADLIEPTAAILAAHGIDADGKPVAKGARFATGTIFQPEIFTQAGDFEASPSDAPAPSTRVDDRWFQAACAALNGLTAVSYDRQEEAPIGHVRLAAEMADALMAEVAKREGR